MLLASCFETADQVPGGLFGWDGTSLHAYDRDSGTGLAYVAGRVARCMDSPERGLRLYDSDGTHSLIALADEPGLHDVVWTGRYFIVAATMQNAVIWLTRSGNEVRRWQPTEVYDAWHLNGVAAVDHEAVITAFGEYNEPRGWVGRHDERHGFLYDVGQDRYIAKGLQGPHSPVRLESSWLLCNAVSGELLEFSLTGDLLRSTTCGQNEWARGLACTADSVFVGLSPNRRDGERASRRARIVELDRGTWRKMQEFELPCTDVYSMLHVPVQSLRWPRA